MTDNQEPAVPEKGALEKIKGPWPQHDLLASYLRDGILSGEYPPGTKLPTTNTLREQFGVAPQTIKNATDQLVEEGLVVSHKGRGIFVREHRQRVVSPADFKQPSAPGEPYAWVKKYQGDGLQASSNLRRVEEVEPPADVRAALGLAEGDVAVLREQVLSLNEEPAELVRSYYPVELARGTQIAEARKIKGGTPRVLADMGFPPVSCEDFVSARIPTPAEVEALKMPTKLPVLRLLRVVRSVDYRVIEVTVLAKAGHLYEQRYEF